MRILGSIGTASAVVAALALTVASFSPTDAARTGEFGNLPETQDDWWNTCPYTGPCDDTPTYKVPKPPRLPKLKPPPAPTYDPSGFRVPKTPTIWVKTRYQGPGSKPQVRASDVPSTSDPFLILMPSFHVAEDDVAPAKTWRARGLSKKKPGIYRSKEGTTILARVNRIAAPTTFERMKAYNKGVRKWNQGRQRGFTGGVARRPDPEYGGGIGWRKVKATPYRSRKVGFIPKVSSRQALSALVSAFATAVNGEPTKVKVGGFRKPKSVKASETKKKNRKKARKDRS